MDEASIFLEALQKLSPEARVAFLDQACGSNDELRRSVELLLKAHDKAGQFLAPSPLPTNAIVDQPAEMPGTTIGPYKLLEQIGEGGMGTVWMAQQTEPVKRVVALKVIKAGMDSKQFIARFEAERQALALMEHANIARVLDGGTTSAGRPYFVMDLVKGVPITQYCDQYHLTPRQRLELFIPVCQAVQHAHQKGIVHRDLKPSNVLVALHDNQPVPKVIDFGIAKAVGHQLTEETLHTGFGAVVGTVEYMSPEQATLNQLDVDTRSDVYSLGVLLYELLAGSPPFSRKELEAAGLLETLRLIREQEPTKPSAKLSTAEGLPTLAANRGTEPAKLTTLVRGELDWIVMRALEKDRSRRYQTASGLAVDLQHYLSDQPVVACPQSAGYRFRKFVRRNRGTVLACLIILLLLVGGIIGTTWGMIRAQHARRNAMSAQLAEAERADGERRAKEEAQKRLVQIEQGTEILASVFRDLDPIAADNAGVTLRDLLCGRLFKAAQQLEGEAVGDPLIVARLQHLLGISLFELGHRKQAEELLGKASRTRERLLGAEHLDTAATKHHLAVLCRDRGEYALAETLYKEVLAVRTATLGNDNLDTAVTKHHMALLYHSQGKYDPAEELLKEVLAIRSAKLGADNSDTLTTQHRLAAIYRSQARYELSETLHKEVLAIRTATLGPDHLDTVATKASLGGLYHTQGRFDLAERLYNEVLAVRVAKLGAEHPDTLNSRLHLASLYHWQDKTAVAESMYKEVLTARIAKLGADDPATLFSQNELATLYHYQGNFTLAESLYKEVLTVGTAKLGPKHPVVLSSQQKLAMLYWSTRKLDLAIPLLEEVFKLKNANLRPEHPDKLAVQANLGLIYCAAGRFAEAIPLLEQVHQKDSSYLQRPWFANGMLMAYVRTGNTTEATALVTQQVQAAHTQFAADSPQLATALTEIGKLLLDAKEYAEAEPLLMQGYEGMKRCEARLPLEDPRHVTETLEPLVQLYDAWDRPDQAAKWRKELEKVKERP
jgi:serine/threonine protein kinase/tetratricopeptide (TPR) repeat protein